MKLLRETIRRLILEDRQLERFENLLPMLDSYELESVKPAIEMCTAIGFAKLIKHSVNRGKNRGGRIGAIHVFTLQPEEAFMDFFRQMFDKNGGTSPKGNITDGAAGFTMKNLGKQEIEISAEDSLKNWSDYCDDWMDRSVTQVELPV